MQLGGRLLEPFMALEVAVEEEAVGAVLNDLTSQVCWTLTCSRTVYE